MIPPIWFLEINRINVKLGIEPINQTEGDELTAMIEKGLISKANLNDKTVSEYTNCFFFLSANQNNKNSISGFIHSQGEREIEKNFN